MLKGFMDGSLGSRTAALNAPYSDEPTNSGIPRYDQKTLNQMATDRAQAGFQLGFHAIGDRANDMALDAFEQARHSRNKTNSPPSRPVTASSTPRSYPPATSTDSPDSTSSPQCSPRTCSPT